MSTSRVGTPLDPRTYVATCRPPSPGPRGVDPGEWTPRELRHSFVSLLSDSGVPLEEIFRLVGHSRTAMTELIYRHQIRRSFRRAPWLWIVSLMVRGPRLSVSFPEGLVSK